MARIQATEDQYSVGRIQKCGVVAVQLPESRVLNFSGFSEIVATSRRGCNSGIPVNVTEHEMSA